MFIVFIAFVIIQRLSELYISKQTEKWLLANGAVEYGKKHYPFMVAMHTLFIIAIIGEFVVRGPMVMDYFFAGCYIALIVFKYWIISTLGHYWNTRIYRIPGSQPVMGGPYKFVRHPNYIGVIGEIVVIPLVFHLWYTAAIFTVLNAIMLTVRIREENNAWRNSAPQPAGSVKS